MLRIHSIETFGTHEGPGIRLVIFLQGCHFRCVYCHNPDTWDLKGGREIGEEDIIKKLERQRAYLQKKGGLTVSGGEPLIQRASLITLFSEAKKHRFHTSLDTNGSILDEFTQKLLDVTDLVLLDIKHIDRNEHMRLTGAPNDIPLQFAKYCEDHDKKMWLRYVLVPGYTDQAEFLHEWGRTFTDYQNIERVEILPYHTLGVYKYRQLKIPYRLENVAPPTQDNIKNAQNIFRMYFKTVKIR